MDDVVERRACNVIAAAAARDVDAQCVNTTAADVNQSLTCATPRHR